MDPVRTCASGKVDIGAFRTYPAGHTPADDAPNEYQPIPLDAQLKEVMWSKNSLFLLCCLKLFVGCLELGTFFLPLMVLVLPGAGSCDA